MVSIKNCTDDSQTVRRSPQWALWLILLAGCQSQLPLPPAPVEDTGQEPVSQPAPSPGSPASPEADTDAPPAGVNRVVKVLQHRADQHGRRGEWLSAIEVAEQGLRIDRRHSPFYRILAQSYQALGDPASALRFARQARRFCQRDCAQLDRLLERLSVAGP